MGAKQIGNFLPCPGVPQRGGTGLPSSPQSFHTECCLSIETLRPKSSALVWRSGSWVVSNPHSPP